MFTYIWCKRNHKRLTRIGKIVYATGAVLLVLAGLFLFHEDIVVITNSRGFTDNLILYTGFLALAGINSLYGDLCERVNGINGGLTL